jgi:hypothetical protein
MQATKPDNFRQSTLTSSQERAIDALLAGATDTEAGAAAGVTRQTLNNWKNHHPTFVAEMNLRRQQIWGASLDRLRALLPKALDALDAALSTETPNTRVAMRVVELAGIGNEGIAPTGPTTTMDVIDAEVHRRRQADFDAMIGPFGEPVSELERARVALEWANADTPNAQGNWKETDHTDRRYSCS